MELDGICWKSSFLDGSSFWCFFGKQLQTVWTCSFLKWSATLEDFDSLHMNLQHLAMQNPYVHCIIIGRLDMHLGLNGVCLHVELVQKTTFSTQFRSEDAHRLKEPAQQSGLNLVSWTATTRLPPLKVNINRMKINGWFRWFISFWRGPLFWVSIRSFFFGVHF